MGAPVQQHAEAALAPSAPAYSEHSNPFGEDDFQSVPVASAPPQQPFYADQKQSPFGQQEAPVYQQQPPQQFYGQPPQEPQQYYQQAPPQPLYSRMSLGPSQPLYNQQAGASLAPQPQVAPVYQQQQELPPAGPTTPQYTRLEASPYKDIAVTDPEKINDSYIAYKLHVTIIKDNRVVVGLRRFSDFYWLMTQLTAKFPGVIVPPTPEKKEVGKFNIEFLEMRRAGLESMVKRIANHPILMGSPDVKLFFETENLDSVSDSSSNHKISLLKLKKQVVDAGTRANAGKKSFFDFLGAAISGPLTKMYRICFSIFFPRQLFNHYPHPLQSIWRRRPLV